MPDKGGYWLIGQVRDLPPERGGATPAAALTGFTGPEHRASILRAGSCPSPKMVMGLRPTLHHENRLSSPLRRRPATSMMFGISSPRQN